jgi:hypothetical protein
MSTGTIGQWKEAEALDVVVMERTKHTLGEEHPDTLTSISSLAATYQNQGQWKKAEALNRWWSWKKECIY